MTLSLLIISRVHAIMANQLLATHNIQEDTMKKLLIALLPTIVSRVLKARQAKKQGGVPAAKKRRR